MKKLNSRLMVLFVFFSLFFGGCAITQKLQNTEKYNVSISSSYHKIYFTQIKVNEEGGKFEVSGKLKIRGHSTSSGPHIPHYVEVALFDQNGAAIDRKKVLHNPRHVTKSNKRRVAKFSAIFNEIPPQGTTIRLSNVN